MTDAELGADLYDAIRAIKAARKARKNVPSYDPVNAATDAAQADLDQAHAELGRLVREALNGTDTVKGK